MRLQFPHTGRTIPKSALPLCLGVLLGLVLALNAPLRAADNKPAAEEKSAAQTSGPLTREDVESIIKEYLLDNPEVILDAVDVYQQRQKQAAQEAAQKALESHWDELTKDPHTFAVGPADAKVTLIEFFDYNCGYCRAAAPSILKFTKKYPQMRVVFKEYPIRGPDSLDLAKAALASMDQGKYIDLYRSMMTSEGQMTMSRFETLSKPLKLDVAKVRKKMNDQVYEDTIDQTHSLADSLHIDGTPSFILGKKIIRGWPGEDQMDALIQKEFKADKQDKEDKKS